MASLLSLGVNSNCFKDITGIDLPHSWCNITEIPPEEARDLCPAEPASIRPDQIVAQNLRRILGFDIRHDIAVS